MAIQISAIILRSRNVSDTLQFYKALGIEMQKESDTEKGGPDYYSCRVDGTRFAVYAMELDQRDRRAAGQETMLGFLVKSVEKSYDDLIAIGSSPVIEPEDLPGGRHAVVLDPDGRPVELNENS